MLLASLAIAQSQPTGMYARSATPVWELMWDKSGPQGKHVQVPSPDRSSVLTAKAVDEDSGVQIFLRKRGAAFWKERFAPGCWN